MPILMFSRAKTVILKEVEYIPIFQKFAGAVSSSELQSRSSPSIAEIFVVCC